MEPVMYPEQAKDQVSFTRLFTPKLSRFKQKVVIKEKDFKLTTFLDKIIQVNKQEFDYFLVKEEFTNSEKELLNMLAVVEQIDKPPHERIEYTKSHFDLLFYHEHKDDLTNMLDARRRMHFNDE